MGVPLHWRQDPHTLQHLYSLFTAPQDVQTDNLYIRVPFNVCGVMYILGVKHLSTTLLQILDLSRFVLLNPAACFYCIDLFDC
jgi:hypothetical protein